MSGFWLFAAPVSEFQTRALALSVARTRLLRYASQAAGKNGRTFEHGRRFKRMKLRSVMPMRVAKYGSIAVSVIICCAGAAMALHPALSANAIRLLFGLTMLALGIIKLIGYFSKDLFRLAFQYDLQFGALLCILGLIALARRGGAVEFVCAAFGISMLADCLFKGKTAMEAKRFGIRQWWLTLAFAAAAGIAGILAALAPAEELRRVNAMLGISLCAEGALSLSVAVSMVKIVRHQRPDALDAEICENWEDM